MSQTFNENVDQLDLRFAESVSVGNIPGSSSWCWVDTGASSSLESHFSTNFFEVFASREKRHFNLIKYN